jgi:hypothetical protein
MDPLRELADTRQIPGEPKRRWFTSLQLDLFIWVDEADQPVGFQLCYDKNAGEHAFTWREGRGYDHSSVDDGEDGPSIYKSTPILRANGYFNRSRVKTLFLEAAAAVPTVLREFVSERLDSFPERPR